jgi:hypothetical protein
VIAQAEPNPESSQSGDGLCHRRFTVEANSRLIRSPKHPGGANRRGAEGKPTDSMADRVAASKVVDLSVARARLRANIEATTLVE